jgi:hypothetical protein
MQMVSISFNQEESKPRPPAFPDIERRSITLLLVAMPFMHVYGTVRALPVFSPH